MILHFNRGREGKTKQLHALHSFSEVFNILSHPAESITTARGKHKDDNDQK